ncbi:MAG: hypothetical protein KGL58_04805, partial [Pseudomonadota bacterium]|nr:hypothetical protein [Pseudomonadota bacterium]
MNKPEWLNGTLYQPQFEQDSCGFGLMAQMDNHPSHWLVKTAISSLGCLTHRGAVAADGLSGDGCGLMFKKPDAFLRKAASKSNIHLEPIYACGTIFLSQNTDLANKARTAILSALVKQGLNDAAFRIVPTNP